jgi:hypothetical protein
MEESATFPPGLLDYLEKERRARIRCRPLAQFALSLAALRAFFRLPL